ncbi:MAG: preprotein translocase subunit SecY [Candidatus Micrarchaeia archaeon]
MGITDVVYGFGKFLPTVRPPTRPPTVKERFMWTLAALILYFVMYNTTIFGAKETGGGLDFLQVITASKIGSLLTTGIGPIVLASIFLQLFNGAGLLNFNLRDPQQREKFQILQKLLAILIAFFEAYMFASGRIPISDSFANNPGLAVVLMSVQIAIGSVILMYLDEVVTKYGIGSGISLFIAAGVSFSVVAGTVALFIGDGGVLDAFASGGADAIANALLILLPIFSTIAIFLVVVYGEGTKVEVPISFAGGRGTVNSLPFPLFYVSNIPVIFAAALIMNIQLFSVFVFAGKSFELGGVDVIPYIAYVDANNRLVDGILYLFTPLHAGKNVIGYINLLANGVTPILKIPEWVHAIIYIIFLSLASVLFGMFWVETANMDAKSIANQLMESNIQITGFRRDPRIMLKRLEEYIPTLTILGSFLIGLLAGCADLLGALGTGTGILLTVGIFYRTYLQLKQMNVFELYPSIAGMLE